MRTLLPLTLSVVFGIPACRIHAHEIPVHRAITSYAAASAFDGSPAYAGFMEMIAADVPLIEATNSMVIGSALEDALRNEDPIGGFRSLNHFYDPLTGEGLSDLPVPNEGQPYGVDSFTWAAVLNGAGISKPYNPNPVNEWSWQNARDYQWHGLTEEDPADRREALTSMFRALGQVIHLLQDASQPQHVRNEQHLDKFPFIPISTPWRSPIEDYGGDNLPSLNYEHGILDWRAAGFTKVEDFWDRQLYSGNASALSADAAGGAKLGMAEFANGNLLGARHLYGEYYEPGSLKHYPYPSRNSGTDYLQTRENLAAGVETFPLKNGDTGKAIYLQKVSDGIPVAHHSRFTYFGGKFPRFGMITVNDPKVLSDYHSAMIPKAIEYSAGLLDYFFRGSITVESVEWNGTAYTITIRNTSGQELVGGGKFHVFKDDVGDRTAVTASGGVNLSQNIAHNGTWQFEFPNPEITELTKFIVVYKGTIGLASGQPADPVDSNIAIAAKSFTMTGLDWTQLQWADLNSPSWGTHTFFEDTFSLEATSGAWFDPSSGAYLGQMTYRGPEVQTHVTLSGSVSTTSFGAASFAVAVGYAGETPFFSQYFGAPTTLTGYSIPITIPNTGNVTKALEVTVDWVASCQECYLGDSGYVEMSGTLTNP